MTQEPRQWISVYDQLPEMIGRGDRTELVLVSRIHKRTGTRSEALSFRWAKHKIMSMSFNDEYSVTDTWNGQESNGFVVTHWIPLVTS